MRNAERICNRENGVSETVGFIIIFGIMVTGIGLVTVYGYPMLLQEQQNTNVRNMERLMIVLQNELKSLTYKSVPYQETTLQVSSGTLMIKKIPPSTPQFIVNWDGTDHVYYPGEIHFESQDSMTTLALENGAVHTTSWSSPNGSAMLAEPRWFYDEPSKTFVMTFINLNATDDLAQTAIGTVRMKLMSADQTVVPNVVGSNVGVTYQGNITNNYNIAWRNYFSSLKMRPIDISSDLESTFSLPDDTAVLVVKRYNVTILSL